MSLEFELPLVSLIFMFILVIVYLMKDKIKLVENKMYEKIIIYSLIEMTINLFIHILCAVNDFSVINTTYYQLLDLLNKVLSTCFIGIFVALFNYILIITYSKIMKNYKKVIIGGYIFELITFIILQFTSIELIKVGNVTNVTGSTLSVAYIFVAILILLSLIISLTKRKSKDKRYYAIYFIIGILIALYIMTIVFPGMIIYDVALALLVYIMYFTIENPDVKMLHTIEMAKEQAEKANRAKTDFLSSMSHEIRTPLNAIVGFSDYIISSESIDEAKENAQDIINASQTLLEIVNGILDISKIEAGKMEIVNSKYNAKSTFESLAKLVTPKMKEKGLDFTYYIAPDLPETLFGDHANIKKVVTNLLSNAYKYTEKGAVRYEVNCVNSNNISKLIITVEDTGRGIKQESIDKLFTKFQRLDEDRNTTIEGTGLGLAITKQLIELMGGKILVHTVYGEGSKFTVVLNQSIEKTPVIVEPKTEIKTTLDLKDKKILLVDDNSLNIKVATKILERYNANNITSLDNGFDCIDLIKSGKKFDIILMDDMMPKMSGVETFQKLKELEGFNQPVVILTANAITGMKEKYLNEGFEDYLAKPIEKDELIRVCNTVFAKYQNTSSENKVVEPIKTIEEVEEVELLDNTEELEVIGEDTPSKEDYLKSNDVDLDKALELLGDIEMYNMTISDFLTAVEEKWQNIINYKDNNDMENYAIEVHSLKSDAKYLGFMSLADISYQHELKSKENDSSFVKEHFAELETEYNKALTIAKTYNEMIK